MQYPLIDRELLSFLRLVHGGFHLVMLLAISYQGWLGLSIRRARKAGHALPFPVIMRHRKSGPVLALLVGVGYLFGLVLVVLHTGKLLEHPAHFIVGSLIMLLIVSAVILSRMIKGPDSPYRSPHFALGISILILYVSNVLLGVGVLL